MKHKTKIVLYYFGLAVWAFLTALNYVLFIVPNNFAPAGINGIAVMIQYMFDFNIGYLSLIINVPLCLFAFFKVNRKFAINTLVYCALYSISYIILSHVNLERFKYYANEETIYPVVISGIIAGVITGILVIGNSSMGGTDVIAKYINKKKPDLNFFYVNFILNAAVAIMSYFVYAEKALDGSRIYNYKPVCLCLLYTFVSSYIGNLFISSKKHACKVTIITDYYDDIEKDIINELKHSATRIIAKGAYTNKEKNLLVCIINKHQLPDFENIIKRYPDTFVYVENVEQTIGFFKKIK